MLVSLILGVLSCLSLALLLWQWWVAMRFPLHRRINDVEAFAPPVSCLKPLKGCDTETEKCLRSWFSQNYPGPVQLLFGVAAEDDPVCDLVRSLMDEYPNRVAQLVVASATLGPNAKASKLVELERLAQHDLLVISDADVFVPPDLLSNAVAPFRAASSEGTPSASRHVGLVNCFYAIANPSTPAMRWEAISVNADFWSQVLQAKSLKPLDFALGAVMVTRRDRVREIGGFQSLVQSLADDYLLGNRIAQRGHRIALCPVVVECWDAPVTWAGAWKHQLRWARTIRVCQPLPFFFSILSHAGLWALLWLVWSLVGSPAVLGQRTECYLPGLGSVSTAWIAGGFVLVRLLGALDLQRRLTRSLKPALWLWLVPIKDVLHALIWFGAFAGSEIEWRGRTFQLRPDGTLVPKC